MATSESAQHDELENEIKSKFGDAVIGVDRSFDELVFIINKAHSHEVLSHLKNDRGFDMLLDIAGVDCMNLKTGGDRFELEYILYATAEDVRAHVRVSAPESDLNVDTVTDLWQSANWAEREAFEFFGFNFAGHPNLKRLLTHHEFEGFPLRKDYEILKGQWCSKASDLHDEMNE